MAAPGKPGAVFVWMNLQDGASIAGSAEASIEWLTVPMPPELQNVSVCWSCGDRGVPG